MSMDTNQARKAGVDAFKNGRPCAPALNQAFLVAACASDTDTSDLLSAYLNGWTVANLASGGH
jgi:hypothetical protein